MEKLIRELAFDMNLEKIEDDETAKKLSLVKSMYLETCAMPPLLIFLVFTIRREVLEKGG
jgi:hypothetical protein